ncbi:MAG: anti-sigma factor family protein [Clostridia bacterium]
MSCQEVQDLLSAYIDEEVTKEQQLLISDHLKECQECFKLYEELKVFSGFFLDTPEVDPPDDLVADIMSEIKNLNKVENVIPITKERNTMKFGWQWRKVAAGLAIFFISLAVGILPLVTHNLALESPFELLQNETQDAAREDGNFLTKADDSDASTPEKSANDQQHGIMAQTQNEESDESEESPESFDSREVRTTGNKNLDSEDQGLVEIVSITNLLVAISGSALGIFLIWYAKPGKN